MAFWRTFLWKFSLISPHAQLNLVFVVCVYHITFTPTQSTITIHELLRLGNFFSFTSYCSNTAPSPLHLESDLLLAPRCLSSGVDIFCNLAYLLRTGRARLRLRRCRCNQKHSETRMQ